MPAAFDFVEFETGGQTLTCRREASPATPGEKWWWMKIANESQRYAAFRAEPGDNEANLTPRIIAYYKQLLADRERPREIRPTWGRPPAAAKTPPSV